MELVKRSLGKWIEAAILLVIGICCIVFGAATDWKAQANAADTISITIGIVFVVVGAISIILAIVLGILAKKGFAGIALPGGILLAVGISVLVRHYIVDLIGLLIYVVPFILIVVGAIVLADGIFLLVRGSKSKKTNSVLVPAIITMVLGLCAIVLGSLCVNGCVIGGDVQFVIFGIIVCLVACAIVLLTFVKLPDAVVTVVKVDKE